MSAVYWIHHKNHTDMFSQGYIGVSKNVKKRWYDHNWKPQNNHLSNAIKKYGWDNLIKEVILIGEQSYCLDVEAKLRPNPQIGWNLIAGGGMPPSSLGKKFGPMSDETKAKVSAAKKGFRHTPEVEAKVTQNLLIGGKNTRFKKGQVLQHIKYTHTCEHCGKIGKGPSMKRWHFDNCKFKEIQ